MNAQGQSGKRLRDRERDSSCSLLASLKRASQKKLKNNKQ